MSTAIIGVMSGSSLDGLDMALCELQENHGKILWSIIAHQTITFPEPVRQRLQIAASLSGKELMQLDADFGTYIGEAVREWMLEKNLNPGLIASHGHTVFHEPATGFTTQIGSGAHIAGASGVDTITDFRSADVALHGEGAPFAPIADRDLFSGYDGYLNLGGIANISLFADGRLSSAFDIGPCNQALNFLAEKEGLHFDAGGQLASSGKVITSVVQLLLDYFPITSGSMLSISNELVHNTWLHMLEQEAYSVRDLLASVVEAISLLTMSSLKASSFSGKILVTGGGAHNTFMLTRLNSIGSEENIQFEKPEDVVIDYKESLLMAYLGFLRLHQLPFGIHHLTGARRDSIGGALYKAYQ